MGAANQRNMHPVFAVTGCMKFGGVSKDISPKWRNIKSVAW